MSSQKRSNDEGSSSGQKPKQPKWDFKSMAYFEDYPAGDVDEQIGSGQQQDAVEEQPIDDQPEIIDQNLDEQADGIGQMDGAKDQEQAKNEQPGYKEIAHSTHNNVRFAMSQHKTEFVLNGMLEEPEEALRQAFVDIIDRAILNAEKNGNKVFKLGIMLDGDVLSDPILLPLRQPPQNNADVLMAELDKLGQSGDEEGMDKKTLLLSRPMKLIVTCLTPPTGSAPKFHPYQFFGYNDDHRIRINNTGDRLCLFYALIAAKAYHDIDNAEIEAKTTGNKSRKNRHRDRTLERLLNNQPRMHQMAKQLMRDAEIPDNLDSYGMEHLQPVQNLWDRNHPGMYRIVQFDHQPLVLPRPMWKGPAGRRYNVTLFLSNGHYDGIKKVNCFFNQGRKYCVECECFYQRDEKHTIECKARCYQCGKVGPEYPCMKEADVMIKCADCNRFFFSQRCYAGHKPATCNTWKRCKIPLCQRVYLNDPKKPHKCFTTYCMRCKVYHGKDTQCFIQKIKVPEEKQRYRIVVWDTETRLEQMEGGQQEHKVNYLSARVTCTDCCDSDDGEIIDCKICSNVDGETELRKDWSEAEGHEPVSEFVEWILTAWDDEFETYIFAHNSSRFDGHFVFKYLAQTGRRPEVLMNGLRLYQFTVQHQMNNSKLKWRDSCLMMPIKLEDLKSTFNLQCDDKPFFPYAFNKKENYKVRLPQLPDKEDYCPGSMKKEKFEKFKKWYDENKSTPFYLPEELSSYCQNDTDILLRSIREFRRILMEEVTNGFDVLPISCTIARACINIFLAQYMNENEVAMVPEGGYERNDRASIFAIKYLDWRAKKDDVEILHAGNGREKKMKGYKLDGWIEEDKKAIEVMGCFWHGCERCFSPEDKLLDHKTCREMNEKTQDRLRQLREPDDEGNCIQVEEIWECEILAQMDRDPEMQKFFGDLGNERGPIDPRFAYCGGRTGPLRLFAEADDVYKISVFDIVSLYPWVNFDTLYPVGIPNVIRPTPEEMIVDWTKPEDIQYKGIYKVRLIPPKGLRIPVLPVKMDERLLFCLCHRCASKFRKAGTRCQHRCNHNEQRAYTGSYTHIELERALENGYRVDRFWRAWHYDDWSDQIFKGYVQQFLKLKIEASGFPASVQTEEQKQQFSSEYKRIYGVDLNLESVKKNPGLRFIAKLCLNSLWGKFSMRNTLGENKVITQASSFFKILFDHRVEISAIVPLSDDAIRVLYKPKKDFVKEHACSNIVISLWTTSRARLKLLDYMQQIEQTEGAELLYTDTDSVIVRHLRDKVPLQTGEYLGEMSEEYASHDITTFICGGAKQYGLKMINKRTGETEYVQKVRGITFDVENSKALQFESFKQKVLNYGKEKEEPAVFTYSKIQPNKESNIITREQRKKYLPVCQKGIINDHLEVLPFGYE